MPPRLSTTGGRPPTTRLRLAHLGFVDAAPSLVAQARGYFAEEGLDVQLGCELGLAALTAKLADQAIDGACLPAHFPVLLSLGAGAPRVPMEGVLVCSYQDLAIVLATKPGADGAGSLKLGLLTPGSAARLIVQRWLQLDFAATRVEPLLTPIASSQLVNFLGEGAIDGFCGIEPLPAFAAANGRGAIVARSSVLFPRHPGGAVALRREWAEAAPRARDALGRALLRARSFCADPANADEVWKLVRAHHPAADLDETSEPARLVRAAASLGSEVRFDGPAGSGLDAAGALFVEQACQAACGDAWRHLDLKAEVSRVYRIAEAASAPRPR